MIVVSGTGRSGTSLWMQVLGAAGLPVLGEAMPARYAALQSLNPRGFFESRLVEGVNFATNPDPVSGARLQPEETRDLVVKIFCHGLRRTERRFLDHVLLCTRGWRAFAASFERLQALDGGAAAWGSDPTRYWFLEQVAVLEDARLRGYRLRIQPLERVLADPEGEVRAALAWLGVPDPTGAAAQVVEPAMVGQGREPEVPAARHEALDALQSYLDRGDPGPGADWEALLRWRAALLSGTI